MMGGYNFDSGIEQDDNDLLAPHSVNDPVPDDDPGFEIVTGNYADLSSPEVEYLSDSPCASFEVHDDCVVMVSSQSSASHTSLKEKALRVPASIFLV
jgi:hypothetical protein